MGDDFIVKLELRNAAVIGVEELEQHKSCLRCKRRVEPLEAVVLIGVPGQTVVCCNCMKNALPNGQQSSC